MKILLLGKGISNLGVAKLLDEKKISYALLNTEEVKEFDYDLVVKSPGIKEKNEIVQKFRNKGIQIISDIELVYNFLKPKTIGVTGSNGKTTTVNFIYEMLKDNYKTCMCGNIGYSFGSAVVDCPNNDFYICELSSFELADIVNFAPNISVMLNVKPCHLDYHETFQEYINAKKNITINQEASDYLIYNFDDENLKQIAKDSQAKKISFSANSSLANCYLFNGWIYLDGYKILKTKQIKLIGGHNILNVMAACCVAKILNVSNKNIKKAVKSFNGINYRITEEEKQIYNDAKSTNPYSTIEAIKSMSGNLDLICGGYSRGEYLDCLIPYLSKINRVYVYGASQELVFDFFKKHDIEIYKFNNLREACSKALENRIEKINILYSPMFASYDQYDNYLQRGKEFTDIIKDYFK